MPMTATAHVRPARTADLEPLAQLLAPLPLFQAYGGTAPALAERWREALAKGDGLLVAECEGRPVGVCLFLRTGTFVTGGYLRTLAVDPSLQGQGVGARLLGAFEAACSQPKGGWFLLASDFNQGAHRFYQRHGYREVGRLPDFAKAGIVEVIFWKPLSRELPRGG